MKNQAVRDDVKDVEDHSSISRRSFLKLMGATGGASVALAGTPKLNIFDFTKTAAAQGSVKGEWLPTTCQGCTSWCSKQVYVVDGRAIKVRGNSNSKVNGIASCPRAHLSLQQVYDPDRLKPP